MYKDLLYLGRDYPQRSGGFSKFREVLKANFVRTPVDTAEQLTRASARAKHAEKGKFEDNYRQRFLLTLRVGGVVLSLEIPRHETKVLQLVSRRSPRAPLQTVCGHYAHPFRVYMAQALILKTKFTTTATNKKMHNMVGPNLSS